MVVHERIVDALASIESNERVCVLYACESGSRAWGFPSQDSDYDVRFIYLHPLEWYLSVQRKRDVIERPIDDRLDLSGWELRKALRLFAKSNPPLLEWLRSPHVYWETSGLAEKLRTLASTWFSPKACLYHYLHMAQGNYRDYLQGDPVWLKKYFYVLRPILACRWIETTNTMPPMAFEALVDTQVDRIPLKHHILDLLERKKAGEELDWGARIPIINAFLEQEIERLQTSTEALPRQAAPPISSLDQVFQETLSRVQSAKFDVQR